MGNNIDCRPPNESVTQGLPLFTIDSTRSEQVKQMGQYAETFKPLARTTDPGTSKLAAKQAGSLVINHQKIIIDALSEESAKENAGMTSDEMAIATGLTLVQIARRTSDLEAGKIIYKTDMTRKTRTGRSATVWRLAGN